MRSLFSNLIELFAPQKCLLCGSVSKLLCSDCLPALSSSRQRLSRWPLYVAVTGKDFVQVVVVWKDQRAMKLTNELANLAVAVVPGDASGVLAPIPSRKESHIRRGWEPVVTLGFQMSKQSNLELWPGLFRWKSEPDEQRILSDAERMLNVQNRIECTHTPTQPVWILDDVMTTGSSLLAAANAVEQMGGAVAGFVVLTAPRRSC